MFTCEKTDCHREATHAPEVRCWAKGYPKLPGTNISMVIGLRLCRRCAEALMLEDVVTDAGWEDVRQAVLAQGKAEPDRASVEVHAKPINFARRAN